MSSVAGMLRNSLVIILLEILHSIQFDIDTFSSSTKGNGNCKTIAENHMAQIVAGIGLEKMTVTMPKKIVVLMLRYSNELLSSIGNI